VGGTESQIRDLVAVWWQGGWHDLAIGAPSHHESAVITGGVLSYGYGLWWGWQRRRDERGVGAADGAVWTSSKWRLGVEPELGRVEEEDGASGGM
jgi:hypothetical protein